LRLLAKAAAAGWEAFQGYTRAGGASSRRFAQNPHDI
jgi:hypothetical protein